MPGRSTSESVFRTLIRTLGRLEHVMEPYFARFGISGAQWGVLRNLHRAEGEEGPGGLRLSDLGRRLLVRPPSVTGIVDRLERAGLVVRSRAEGDGRGRRVALTAKGRQLVEHVLVGHPQQMERVLAGLNAGEQAELGRLLAKLNKHLEGLGASGPAPELEEDRAAS